MLIAKCDICGRLENSMCLSKTGKKYKLKFSKFPFQTYIKNNIGEEYTVTVSFDIKKSSDLDALTKAYMNAASKTQYDDEDEFFESEIVYLQNPYPMICDECKHKVMKKMIFENQDEKKTTQY